MVESISKRMKQDEKKVITELMKNSKESIELIAKNCGFSRQKTWRIIKQLEAKKLIWGYTAVFDEEKIGLEHYILLLKRTMKKATEEDVETIISRKTGNLATTFGITIETSAYTHGEYDWIMTFTAKNIIQVKKFVDSLMTLYPNAIQKMPIIQTLMFVKKHYILNPDRKKLKDFI